MENYGNNIECVKALRVNINLYERNSNNNLPNAQYFFPEIPELNGKTIVGIKLNAGTDVLINPVGNIDSLFDLPNVLFTENSQGILQDVAGPRGVSSTYQINIDPYLFLTVYNDKQQQILCNYPVHDLAAYNYRLSGSYIDYNIMGKVRPFDTKINLKESYISSSIILSTIVDNPLIACFTFYYK
jgi:hypothetical protein